MNRTLAIFAAFIMLLSAPMGVNAAGSGSDDNSSSASNIKDTYQNAVKAVNAENYKKAINLLNEVIGKKPRHPDALNYLGFSHRKSGDYARAVSYYKKAISLEPQHRGANEYLGQAYVELGNLDAAVKQLNILEDICGTSCEEYSSLKTSIDKAKKS